MITKTCPCCNETALRVWSMDSWTLEAYECSACEQVFFLSKEVREDE